MKTTESHITEIKEKFSKIETREDLLHLLNDANRILYGEECELLKLNQLTYYADPAKCPNRYRTFTIKKKNGGERQINAPVNGLRNLLRTLNFVLQCCSEPHRAAHGFVLNKSIATNAKKHLGKNYVFNIDLKDFFHSFDRNRVKVGLMQEPFNLNGDKEPIAFLIASLATHPLDIDGTIKIVLPQGSPTSPTLTNTLCNRLDRRLNGLAKKIGATYSRYADDLTFSCNRNVFKMESFQQELKRIIESDQQLSINPKKTRLQTPLHRQEVTGLTVNEKINVPRRYIKQIRMWIYFWEKLGYTKAQQLFTKDYIKDKGHVKNVNAYLENVLRGKLDYLKMVKGENDSTYIKLKMRFDELNNSSSFLSEILDIWNKDGIEAAKIKFYSKSQVNSQDEMSDL